MLKMVTFRESYGGPGPDKIKMLDRSLKESGGLPDNWREGHILTDDQVKVIVAEAVVEENARRKIKEAESNLSMAERQKRFNNLFNQE